MQRLCRGLAVCSAMTLLVLGAGMLQAQQQEGEDMAEGVTIRWWGQACFSTTTADGKCVLNDPFPADFGYASPAAEPQVVLVSHEHSDHNAVENVKGEFEVVRGVGEHEAAGLSFKGVATFHDDEQGAKRGPNTVFVWEMGGVKLAHLGDLGHLLTDEQVEQIGQVDVMMAPTGGFYTIDAAQAVQVAGQLSAKVVIPMHYKTAAIPKFPVATVEAFLEAVPEDWTLEQPEATEVTVTPEDLEAEGTRAVVLRYE